MRKSSSFQYLQNSQKKKQRSFDALEHKIREKMKPLLRIYSGQLNKKIKKGSKKSSGQLGLSSYYTSLNSYHNSQLVSKKHSRQKTNIYKQINEKKFCMTKIKRKNVSQEHQLKIKSQKKAEKNKIRQQNKGSRDKNRKIILKNSNLRLKGSWRNILLRSVLCQQKIKSNFKLNPVKISSLVNQLRSYENQSSTSSKNFIKCALDENQKLYPKTILHGKNRIIIIDWMFLISASMLINRETVHLAIHYMDNYLKVCDMLPSEAHIIAASSLYLSVKQQQRGKQSDLLETICLSESNPIVKNQIIKQQQEIVVKLNFKLKSNTIAFWIDYFSAKWDKFINSEQYKSHSFLYSDCMISLRSSEGQQYKYYRQLVQLSDVLLYFGEYTNFIKAKLALAIIYLVIRVEMQKILGQKSRGKENEQINIHKHRKGDKSTKTSLEINRTQKQKEQISNKNMFLVFSKLFMKKATPIFRDPYNLNEAFNTFLAQLCSFELTQIIPSIKFIANFLDYEFCYNIDQKSFEQSESYEEFIRKMTYSKSMKEYATQKNCR